MRLAIAALLLSAIGCAARHDRPPSLHSGKFVQVVDTELDAKARLLLDTRCASCHSGALASGGFGAVGDTNRLVQEGWLVVGDAELSPLYLAIDDGSMPPGSPFASGDRQTIRDWIEKALVLTGPIPTPTPAASVRILDPELHDKALSLLKTECAGCHGVGSPAYGNFDSVLDVDAMYAKGRLVPGEPAQSPLYLRASDGTMPPGTGLAPAQTALLHEWMQKALAAP